MKKVKLFFMVFALVFMASSVKADIINFDVNPNYVWDYNNPTADWHYDAYGLTLNSMMFWAGEYNENYQQIGGNLYIQDPFNTFGPDKIIFDNPVFLHQFDMNSMPLADPQPFATGSVLISFYDSNNLFLNSQTIDLSDNVTWDNWETITVNLADVKKISFLVDPINQFTPAVDNIEYSEGQPVPEPATMFLLGSGLLGLFGFRNKKK